MEEDFGDLISVYSLERAIEDGVLVEVFKNRWNELSQGKPIVATSHLFSQVSLAGLLEIWNEYVDWRTHVMPTLPEADQLFSTTMNGEKVWVLEEGAAFTMLYPEDYLSSTHFTKTIFYDFFSLCCLAKTAGGIFSAV